MFGLVVVGHFSVTMMKKQSLKPKLPTKFAHHLKKIITIITPFEIVTGVWKNRTKQRMDRPRPVKQDAEKETKNNLENRADRHW